MKMKSIISVALGVLCSLAGDAAAAPKRSAPPNVIVILVDDMGYGDAGFNGCKDIPTPAIDSIAKNGVRFSAGYVTAPQCAPSRSGLLSGRYQNRFGCEENSALDNNGITRGVKLFGDYMRAAGYRTGMVGKWHLGTVGGCHPLERGFDSFYGFLQGSSHYYPPGKAKSIPNIVDGREPQQVSDYLTGVLGDRAIRFIESGKEKPFFLYLAFNAPHSPLEAPESAIARFAHIENPTRKKYAALVSALDDTIGRVLASLRQQGIEEHTLVVFLSDNGGPTSVTAARNDPLRGVKGETLEGGIRVPFAMQWKDVIPSGQTVEAPVSSLDLLPTALAAAGVEIPKDAAFDGINLLPLLTGKAKAEPRTLTWRFPFPPANPELHVWAVRQGNLKLVKEVDWRQAPGRDASSVKGKTGLYQLSEDIAESTDLSAEQPEQRQRLQALYDAWSATLPKPLTQGKASKKK